MRGCVDDNMFFDNFAFETHSAQQLAASEGKNKKATFYINRRIEDLTDSGEGQTTRQD